MGSGSGPRRGVAFGPALGLLWNVSEVFFGYGRVCLVCLCFPRFFCMVPFVCGLSLVGGDVGLCVSVSPVFLSAHLF